MTLTPEGYKPRYADAFIGNSLKTFGAVNIRGPKGCGKTWTSLNHANSALMLDDPSDNRFAERFAKERPFEALEGDRPRLIDEWQIAPDIWNAVRRLVDAEPTAGRIILCGSSTPDTETAGRLHSGAGRFRICRMRTMSLYEAGYSDGAVSLSDMFGLKPIETDWRKTTVEDIAGLVVRGGWPRTIGMSLRDARDYNAAMLEMILEEDIPRIDPSANPSTAKMLIKSIARNESTVASDKTLRLDMRPYPEDRPIAKETLAKYLKCLNRLHLIENQPAFNPDLRTSVHIGKSAKRHLADPSLSAVALGANEEKLSDDRATLGLLFEAMCERDLQIYARALDGELYHFRDGDGREIDAVVELPDGRWGAFEIKLTLSSADHGAENLLKIDKYMKKHDTCKPPSFLCVICGTAECAKLREDGVYVVPITRLRARR